MVIFGDGQTAGNIARELLEKGLSVLMASSGRHENNPLLCDGGLPPQDSLMILYKASCLSCHRSAGTFHFLLAHEKGVHTQDAAAVVVAQEAIREPNYSRYGLVHSSRVISLSGLEGMMAAERCWETGDDHPTSVVFLNGLKSESNPVVCEKMMTAVLKLQTTEGFQTYVLTGNLKVAAAGLEKRYRETSKAGAVYVKFARSLPEISQAGDNRVSIRYLDELTGESFCLVPDLLVVDETIRPAAETAGMAKKLQIEFDRHGFAQADNVHRTAVSTNRKGIYVAGPSRITQTRDHDLADAGAAALMVYLNATTGAPREKDDRACIDTGKCVCCLTCIRVCPYQAVALNPKPAVASSLCERCGICAAECPACAIRIPGLEVDDIRTIVRAAQNRNIEPESSPRLVAFCCSRSAQQAAELACLLGRSGSHNLQMIAVPCAGSIASRFLLGSFREGADGVLVLACHPDNCHSGHGNRFANNRVREIKKQMAVIGLQPERLEFASLAANMAAEFGKIVDRFESRLAEMGPSPLRQPNRTETLRPGEKKASEPTIEEPAT